MKKAVSLLIFCLCIFTFPGITQVKASSGKIIKKKKSAKIQYGTASFYSNKFQGKKTANGDIFSQHKLTAAHNNVPLGTWIRVTNLRNKKTVIVKVTDRLHYRNKRLIDLSRAAANKLSFRSTGLLPIKVEILGKTRPIAKAK